MHLNSSITYTLGLLGTLKLVILFLELQFILLSNAYFSIKVGKCCISKNHNAKNREEVTRSFDHDNLGHQGAPLAI